MPGGFPDSLLHLRGTLSTKFLARRAAEYRCSIFSHGSHLLGIMRERAVTLPVRVSSDEDLRNSIASHIVDTHAGLMPFKLL